MKLVDIIRFIKGYADFTATGGFPERFINLCNIHGIRLWNIEPGINGISASVSAQNFLKLRKIAKNSGVCIKISQKRGMPFLIKKYKHRLLLPIGAVLFLLFIFIMNQFVWTIDVTGTQTINHEEIINTAAEYGLYPGAFIPTLDEVSISRSCINQYKNKIVWMAVNIKGSKAVIEVRDFKDEKEDTTYSNPCNIIADFEGKILSIEVYNGDREVTVGNGVKAGDLLISGVIENRDMSCDYLEARGKITALHSVDFNQSYDKASVNMLKLTSSEEVRRIRFLWADVPLYMSKPSSSDTFTYSEYITCKDVRLPFGIENVLRIHKEKDEKADTDFLFALDSYISDYYYNFRNTNILNVKFTVSNNDNAYIIRAQSDCIDFIGEKAEIYISE